MGRLRRARPYGARSYRSYSLTVGIINEPDNHHGTTTMRLGTAGTPLVLNQEYSQEFELEHRDDQEYIKVSVQENKVYEVYVHGVWDGFPSMSVFTQQDANQPFYPSIPEAACWTTWHRVFATPEDFRRIHLQGLCGQTHRRARAELEREQ